MKKNYLKKIFSALAFATVVSGAEAQLVTVTFTNPSQIQTYTLPTTCGGVTIEAVGAAGGSVFTTCTVSGGRGASMKGVFNFTPGTVLSILAGQMGSTGGADGGGGGGSFVALTQGTVPVIVAGGGGGASNSLGNCTASLTGGMDASITTSATPSRNGLAPGGTNGQGGQLVGSTSTSGGAGGGFYGDGAVAVNLTGGGKAFVNGGGGGVANTVSQNGGFGGGGCSWSNGGGGGGGGGYSGGGGYQQSPYCGGGGGGSYNSGTSQVNTGSVNTGNGYVTISFNMGTAITASASDTEICEGESVTLGVTGSGVLTYSWSTGATGANTSASPVTDSTFIVAATNASNCVSYDTVYIDVNPLPVITSTTSPALLCVGNSATMTVAGAPDFQWDGGPNSNIYEVSPVVTTVYSVTATSGEGCVSGTTVEVTVNSNTMTISPNSSICVGQSATLTAGGAVNYLWSTTPQSPFNPINVSPVITTTYIVQGNDQFGCHIENTVVVTVNPKPTITLSANKTQVCVGDLVQLTAGGGNTYNFGTPVSGTGNLGTVIPGVNLPQTYTVTGIDAAGCTNTAAVTVQVQKCSGLGENSVTGAHIFPNPGNGLFTVELASVNAGTRLHVVDITGKLITTVEAQAKTTVDLTEQPRGIYILQVSDADGTRLLTKLIKE